ncbi:hypothetical protein [Blautia sp.]|uniref:hypothetical protein n=1 Tax=Blautia sp. TaxID=1955243 RepID=UPI00257F0251|nr:hypothetical protein [Blautia sp.]MBS7172577.1 hypothetical protein [Blautia sp.]
MGIILEKSKLVFDELIGANSFDETFKNSIRDYYAYGFKSYDQCSKGGQIARNRWKIFSKVLGEKWYFEKRKNGKVFGNGLYEAFHIKRRSVSG